MRVLCFGDSNTYGYDPREVFGGRYGPEDRWPEILEGETGWTVVNAGCCGRQIPKNTNRLLRTESYACAEVLVVMLGTNDLLQGASPEEAAGRMEGFLSGLLPHYEHILLVAPPPMCRGAWVPDEGLVEASRRLGAEYANLAARLGVAFANAGDWGVELAFDGVHFTEAGNHTFAAGIKARLTAIFPLDSHPAS